MKRDIEQLKKKHFDILVIGGGINGCAIARDAALRGAKAALIEKDDFASGASGNTTKLIHGGIRYLEQGNFKLVYEALHERAILLRTVSHLVRPLEFIMPVYKHDPRGLLKIKTGAFIYDRLAGSDNIQCHRALKKDEVISLERNINSSNLKGAILYYDAQVDDIRLCLDNAISAYKAGCCLANKLQAKAFIKDKGRISGVEVRDKLSQEKFFIRASIVVNATGAWSNQVIKMDKPNAAPITRPTKGVHIVYRKLPHLRAIILSAHKDKRILFIIPWRDSTLITTTDTDYSGSPDEVYASEDDVEYLLEEARRIFPGENIDKKGIITTYTGLRPLVNTQGKPTWQVSREHLIKKSSTGLISVVGGKYTTYRHLAEEVVDVVLSKLKGRNFKKCVTKTTGPSCPREEKLDLPQLIKQTVKEEMANTLNDLLVRRLKFSFKFLLDPEHLEEYASIMANLLGWAKSQKKAEIDRYNEEVRKNMAWKQS